MKIATLVLFGLSSLTSHAIAQSLTDSDSENKTLSLQGTVVEVSAIGGETTGYALRDGGRTFLELDFSSVGWEKAEVYKNRNVVVEGELYTNEGIERTYKVLLVSHISTSK